jgi:hypothetical protein
MPMNGNAMGTDIAEAIMDSKATAAARAKVIENWQKIGDVIVKHIQDNADVQAGIPVKTTGTATAQTGKTDDIGKVK